MTIQVAIMSMDEIEKNIESIIDICTEDEIEKINRYRKEEDRYHRLGSLYLQRTYLAQMLAIEPKDIILVKTEEGKPYCEQTDIQFNVSHHGEYVVLALSNAAIGIDLVKISDFENFDISLVTSKTDFSVKQKAEHWALLEAYTKMKGTGLQGDLNKIDFILSHNGFCVTEDNQLQDVELDIFDISDDYLLAYCTKI
jgi:4'-phosphopantetheinyl transferase